MSEKTLLNIYSDNKKKALRYISKYMKELQLHFNLDNSTIIGLLEEVIKRFKKNQVNKWWSFFK